MGLKWEFTGIFMGLESEWDFNGTEWNMQNDQMTRYRQGDFNRASMGVDGA